MGQGDPGVADKTALVLLCRRIFYGSVSIGSSRCHHLVLYELGRICCGFSRYDNYCQNRHESGRLGLILTYPLSGATFFRIRGSQ